MQRPRIDSQLPNEQNALQRIALFDPEFRAAFPLGRATVVVCSLLLYGFFLAVAHPWTISRDEVGLLIASWVGGVVCGFPAALVVVSYVVEMLFKAWDILLHLSRGDLRFKLILVLAPAAAFALLGLGFYFATVPIMEKYGAACWIAAPILLRYFITGFWSWMQLAKQAPEETDL